MISTQSIKESRRIEKSEEQKPRKSIVQGRAEFKEGQSSGKSRDLGRAEVRDE